VEEHGIKEVQVIDTRLWRYHKIHGAKLFACPEDVPTNEGWVDTPDKFEKEALLKGDVEVGEPEIEEIPVEDVVKTEIVKPKRKYRRKKGK